MLKEKKSLFPKLVFRISRFDVNHTRVSVVTFSSRGRVIRHVDYLADDHKDRHKCSLLEEDLRKIDYSGGGTYTLGALLEAKKVLTKSRATANKAIFLVTDGFSNGGDPRPVAKSLRQKGIKMFTFGIQNGNVRELYDMASHPKNESTYILDSFEEFEALAKRALHEDLTSGRYIEQRPRKCNRLCVGRDCCDTVATCNCGTHTGKYECMCPAGYFGNGLTGGCQACPSGTYKSDKIPGDVFTCTKCPDENHITVPGATSVQQCVCRKGFRNFKNKGCAVLKCPALEVPKNGYFVNDKCKNVFNAACGLRCKPGYELRGSSLRICREDGTWSGTETECIMKTCPALMTPKNGNMICTTDDFSFNTVCRFTCDTGYKLVGSRKRTCLAIAFWTGINTRCREITCRPLPIVRDGSIYPPACTAGDVAFGTTCSVTCHPGYSLIGPHSKQCLPEGVWTPASDVSQCVDTAAPFIMCPYNIEAETDLNENTATVSWQVPLAVDNSGYVPILSSIPAVMPPEKFPVGTTKVTYIAEDLNKNGADCHFYVIVKDKQAPTIDRCFSPLPIVSPEPYADVSWEEPIFSDNSGNDVMIRRSHAPGLFPKGKTEVIYKAYDDSGNSRSCVLKINIIPHPCEYPPVPLNGNRTCYEDSEGVVCKFMCKEGYDFAIQPAEEYRCAFDNVWEPKDQTPISDCSALQQSHDVIQPASFTFAGLVACQQRIILTRLEKDFEHRVTKRINELCEEGVDCSIRDLETTCEQQDGSGLRIVLGRDKRSVMERRVEERLRKKRQAETDTETVEDKHAIITFNYLIAGSVGNVSDSSSKTSGQEQLLQVVENIKKTLKKDAKRGDFNIEADGKPLQLQDMKFDDSPVFECEQGSVVVDNACANCPVGTFFNVVSEQCEACPKGTFQPSTGQLSCLYCPTNTSTPGLHATSEDNCKALCLPGTFSYNGLEICETCRRSYYQDEYGQTDCKKCQKRHTTVRRGSRTDRECKEKCAEGYVSRTGLQPCWPCPIGTYQPKGGKSSCIKCPANSDTAQTASTQISQCEFEQSDGPQNIEAFEAFGGQQQEIGFDDCLKGECLNGATCKSELFGFECICAEGYKGVYCQDEVDECSGNPCQNGGTCTDRVADYECTCLSGFTGKKCETNIDDCLGKPCDNGGTCIDEIEGFTCSCANGFEGPFCEVNIDECKSAPCMNGGTCKDKVAGYDCKCPKGIKGEQCEIDEDDCASGPCQNDAKCKDSSGTFKCECEKGFEGDMCDINIDDCASNPCAAGAKCEDLIGSYKCHCPSGTTGPDCTSEIDIYFQLDFPSTASTTDYARVDMDKDLTSVTVCFWMKTDDRENQGTPFSYANADGDNIFTLTDYDGFVFYVNGDKVTTTVSANDGIWHHVCVLWSSNRGSWKIYMDGIPMDSGRKLANGQTIKGGGQFVVGQEQDSLGGGFSSPESFIGQISQLNMWGRALSLGDIESLRLNCTKQMGDVISWADVSGKMQGAVTDSPVEFCKECPPSATIENGAVTNTGLEAGAREEYTCKRGFQLAGRRERLCLVTGEWEGKMPTCARVQCGYPGTIDNGWIEGERYTYDNRIRYDCDRGYRLVGPATRYCGEFGFWEGDEPVCERIKCTIPVLSENTLVSNPSPDNKYEPGQDVFFECKPGNEFFTKHTSVYCQNDGTFDVSIPTCDPQKCGIPLKIDYGNFPNAENLKEFPVGHIAQYTCEFGYKFSQNSINPSGKINCLPTGEWEANLPECVVVTCRDPSDIDHGQYEKTGNTFLDQARYSCDQGYGLSHSNVLECYETGEWSPKPPECIPVRCGRPDDILHGFFEGDVFTYKEIVTYKCDLGYKLVGKARRECLEDTNWSGKLPVCKPVSCGKPDEIDHGQWKGREYTLNNVIRYVCDEGYELDGPEERICRETGKWQNGSPTCNKIECDIPPSIDNGFYTETSFFYQDNVTYTCENGFYMEGEAVLICLGNKRWSQLPPSCQAIECFSPPNIDHASYSNPERLETFRIGYRVTYQCDAGYELSRNSLNPSGEIECLETGQWEANLPECFIVTCPQPLSIQYGNAVVSSVNLEYGSFVRYICNAGYELEGEESLTCESDGTWSGEPPLCRAIECVAPPVVLNGRLDYKDLKLGSVIRYMCNEGYELSGLEVRRCLASLTWEGEEPVCLPVNCGIPEDVANGLVEYEDTLFQATAQYSCNNGYFIVGDKTRVCTKDKIWSGEVPTCQIVQCDKPSHIISNGRMEGEVFTFGSVITYECDAGYYIDGPSNERKCLASGQWDKPIPVCTAVECPRLNIRNGFTSSFQTEFGTTVTISCRSGYRLQGASNRTCQEDGSWSGEETVCVKYACPRLNPPVNGQVFVQRGRATYACIEGYTMNGPDVRECQSDNTWSLAAPTCDAVPCEDITAAGFQNGFMTYDQLTFGSSIIFECDAGYSLVGERKLDCQYDGTWSGSMPFCDKKTCFPPFIPANTKIVGTDFTFGATIEYQCDEGYRVQGNTRRECQADGSWSGSSPICLFIICPRPEPNRNVVVLGTSYTYGSELEYSCNDGYELDGPSIRRCTESGEWSGKEPFCTRNECPRPPPFQNGQFFASSYSQGSNIIYSCNEGYELIGISVRLCLSTLEWSGDEPYCQRVQCPDPPPLDNGFYDGYEFYYGDVVEYKCNTGYDLVGQARRLCLSVGQWGGADATCIKINCGPPPVRNNVVYNIPGGDKEGKFEATASLSCEEGYQGRGVNFQRCQANGAWTESNFVCEIVTCPEFPTVGNGRILGQGNQYGTELEIQCDEGYYLIGKARPRCGPNGDWDYENQPYCELSGCPDLPKITNGLSTETGSGVGAVVTYSCDEGYRLQGSNRRTCEKGGSWSGSDPYCRLIICEVPPFVDHSVPFDSLTQYLYKSKARYVCETGYELSSGDSTLTCSESGAWSGTIPTCSLVQCGEPTQVPNSKVAVASYNYEGEAQYLCYLGYRVKGSSTITCGKNGNWIGTPPECVPIDCGTPPYVPNSMKIDSKNYTFKSVINYVCDVGFHLVGQQTTSCLATGVWSGIPPVCEPISCGTPPEIENAIYRGNDHFYTSTVTYECFPNFEISGNPTLTCAYDGSWKGVRPECHAVTCGPPPVFPHSSTTMPLGANVGSVVSFMCNDGFYLLGSATARCTESKQWEYEGEPPVCEPKDCLDPPELKNGYRKFTETLYESTVRYFCDAGYTLLGQDSLRCGSKGQWEGKLPTCELLNCGVPPHGDHVIVDGDSYTYQSKVTYSCENGYKLLGESVSVCTETGDWSVQSPQCERVTCKQLILPENGIVLNGDLRSTSNSGDRVELDCNPGYQMIGNGQLECLETGIWSSEVPKCEPTTDALVCGVDTGVEHARELSTTMPVGSVETLVCDAGYTETGDVTVTCQEDLTWSQPAGFCSRVFCGKPRLRDFVNVVRIRGASYFYGDEIQFQCRAGVAPARSPPIIRCLSDGSWDGEFRCGVTCKRPCQHGGICLGLNRCKCPTGYGGAVCEKAKCILPCFNGGRCTAPYLCTCPPGYEGVRCQRAVCSKPCANGGKCVKPNKCRCRYKYSGRFCENKKL
ncbi:sushi, von Willebrand factor type A, EGF and pentraxin domain-containing protein 1-like [Mercenaria mercenaria]|uniref:sushi, von Willebrand factor type A, EGF and pentraxin domain-containing protein 1-like n=1 Tax=Mercenaria mercenaria TaxID=6596 RepID=UPI00234E9CC4|nr:sushi, von Willebrand factor type A, EGF and pentraxin domain-containing protein 1-like [Mercenaria mercenaria]